MPNEGPFGGGQVDNKGKAREMAEAGNYMRSKAAEKRRDTSTPFSEVNKAEDIANRREELMGIIYDLQKLILPGEGDRRLPSSEKLASLKLAVDTALEGLPKSNF
jgi:hypothetical protein